MRKRLSSPWSLWAAGGGMLASLIVAIGCTVDRSRETAVIATQPTARTEPGCWVDVYSDTEFKGLHLRVVGPAKYPNLIMGGDDWSNDIESLVVGPNTWVKVHKDKNFSGPSLWLVPNQRIKNLADLNFTNAIESMELFDRFVTLPERDAPQSSD
jgi:hypothetical protein